MLVSRFTWLATPSVVLRGVAAVLLLLAIADISLAGTCCADCSDASGVYAAVVSQAETSDAPEACISNGRQHEHPMTSCEDCFCCSLKPLPESGFEAVERLAEPSAEPPSGAAFPSSPPRIPFHPPRSA
jgi:hypothetical protein